MTSVAELIREASKLDRDDRVQLISSLLEDFDPNHHPTNEETVRCLEDFKLESGQTGDSRSLPETVDLSQEVSMEITIGHLFLAWQVMSEKFSALRSNDDLLEEERWAIWGLADLLEWTLVENGVGGMTHDEWDALCEKAREFAKNIPVDCLE